MIAKLGGNPIQVGNDKDESVERNNYGEVVGGKRIVKKLFDEIAPRYADRAGGYTRIIKLGRHRLGDAGELVLIQFCGAEEGPEISGQGSTRRRIGAKRKSFAEQRLAAAKSNASAA